jgi:LysM repeat protein
MTLRSASVRLAAVLLLLPGTATAQSLRGSPASLDVQNEIAREHDFSLLRTPGQVTKFVDAGFLIPVRPSAHVQLHEVSFPYARPEVGLFVSRLGEQYHASCGEPMVVTSLTRPESEQPINASDRSVHPTGMAVDLRVPKRASCRRWLETVLLDLENKHVLEATRERRPSHFHVAVFPRPYLAYVGALPVEPAPERAATTRRVSTTRVSMNQTPARAASTSATRRYKVREGDSLWTIARRNATTVAWLRETNGLSSSKILPGQTLRIPATL